MNYLLLGTSTRLIDKKIKELIDFNDESISFNMQFNTIPELLEEATYHSLFMDKKNLIVTNSELIPNNKELEKLLNYLDNSNELTNIIFISKEKMSASDFVNHFKKNNTLIDLIKDKVDLNKTIIDYCKENKYTIESNAINCLKTALSSNPDLILNELDKLFLYYSNPCEITYDVVKNNCSNIIEENNFKFVDYVMNKNYNDAFNYIDELKVLKVDPLSLFNLLVREYRLLLLYKIIEGNNLSFNDYIKTYNLKDWQLDKIAKRAYNIKEEELERVMKLLGEYDYKYKSGLIEKDYFLDLLLLDIIKY